MTISEDFKPAREGDQFLLTVAGYWGKGDTVREAKANVRKAGGKLTGRWVLQSVHPSTAFIDALSVSYPEGHRPIELARNFKETKL